ncbi:hypothetical protein [Conchiformibius kuhniae]|uniref:hypothetical protein n=1 Tax=Conchiformibius kuhniae TaxID=211502 RepID=UPI0012EBDB1C|nr:hypothetical protein [Conchiformibius kuhniae]
MKMKEHGVCHHLNFSTENQYNIKIRRHSRVGGNPPSDDLQAIFYQSLLRFDLDSRIRGNDGTGLYRSIDGVP